MDPTNKALLEMIQHDFPVASRPYQVIGERLGISEGEVMERISGLKEEKIIRRIGGVFASAKLGYTSLLCAVQVPPEEIDRVAEIVNAWPGVTHNYQRSHQYNLWFTLISENEEERRKTLADIQKAIGYPVNALPALRLFKLRAVFQIPGGEA